MAHKTSKMNKILATLFTGCIVVLSGCSSANNSTYQYPFKTAKIEYAISGTTEGKSTVMMKGDKSVREAHIVFHKPTGDENQNNMYIDAGKYVYSVDLDKKTATMTQNPLYETLSKVDPAKRADFLKKIAAGVSPDKAASQALTSIGTETVAGQVCEIYETGGYGQICLWNAIPLKTSINIPDLGLKNNTIATSVQTDVDVPDSAFEVPQGVTVQRVGVDTAGTTQQ